MNKRNHEHYKDPTPYDAIKKLQAEADAADARRMDDALRIAKMAFAAAGFGELFLPGCLSSGLQS
ncbi:Uncharacterised protein [uncultured Ruminococcus sp.]|nr:Uncharacterised protein [uncultured Ruminococcus sp.]